MNDYEFWNKYLQNLLKEIKKICNKKREIYIDFHIHSNKSSDGKQNLNDILETTNQKGFDIIALTDHDNLDIYDEVYEYVKTGFTRPLIVPGIEFTLDNSEYGSQFHMLQLFINPRDEIIIQNVTNQKNAMFNRSKIQFKRIEKNEALQNIFKRNEIIVSYDEYLIYLKENKMMPEYDSLVSYLMEKLKKKGITTFIY